MRKRFLLISSLFMLSFILLLTSSTYVSALEEVHVDEVWISGFDDPVGLGWFTTSTGDASDLTPEEYRSHMKYIFAGEESSYDLALNKPLDNETWIAVNNSDFPARPDDYYVTSEGFYATQLWGDTIDPRSDQATSIHFDTNVSIEEDMVDYTIISASVSAEINASVHADNNGGGGIEIVGETSQGADWDYIRYYLLVSDLSKEKVYEIAQYQTGKEDTYDLGNNTRGTMDEFNETLLFPVPEENLKFFLTSVLNSNGHDFTFTVGFRIFAEDNVGTDRDYFDYMWIKNVDLDFTYQKKMNQLTTLSYDGYGESLNSTNVLIKDASFEFKHRINRNWSTTVDSPNSEFRMFVCGKQITETIKLSSLGLLPTKTSIYNVTSLISLDELITLSIQVYIGDNFDLAEPIVVTIDDVVLKLSYVVYLPDPPQTPLGPYVYGSASLLAALATGIGLYEGIFKYPAAVRTVKGLRRKIRRGRSSHPIHGKGSEEIGRNIFEEEKRHLDKVSSKPQHSQPSKKAAPKKDASSYKDTSPPVEKKMPEKKIKGSEKNA